MKNFFKCLMIMNLMLVSTVYASEKTALSSSEIEFYESQEISYAHVLNEESCEDSGFDDCNIQNMEAIKAGSAGKDVGRWAGVLLWVGLYWLLLDAVF